MGDAPVLPGAGKGDALADDGDAESEELTGGGQVKVTRIDESAPDSTPHAASALTGSSKLGAHSVHGVPKKRRDAVRAAFALLASPVLWAVTAFALLASPVLSAFAAISGKLTPTRAVFLVSTLVALWLSAGQPSRAVWTFTVIAISYLALWTIYLTAALQPLTVLVSLSYVMLLAISVTHLSSAAGVFLMLLDTAYAAGLFGYALAEYRQRKGSERSAEALQTRVKQEELKNDKAVITMVSLYATVASLLSAAGAAWVIFYATDMYWVVVLLSLLIDLSLFCWAGLVGMHLLHGVLFADDQMAFIFWGTVLLVLPDFLLSYLFGEAIGVLVHLIGLMGVAGILGYSLSVYVCYKHIRTQ
jgi:hypothetical protein